MSQTVGRGSAIDELNEVNREVAERVAKKIGVNPRTRVVGFLDTFTVDISRGYIYAKPSVDREVAEGYLTHENGHRSVFPASNAGWMAFASAIKALAPDASNEEVVKVANAVADVFTDYALLSAGLGSELAKRTHEFIMTCSIDSFAMVFKVLMYKAIENAARRGSKQVSAEDLENARRWLASLFKHPEVVDEARNLAVEFVSMTNDLLTSYKPKDIAEFLLNPFRASHAPPLAYLAKVAAELIRRDKESEDQQSRQQCPFPSQKPCTGSGGSSKSQQGSGGSTNRESPPSRSEKPEQRKEGEKGKSGADKNEKEHGESSSNIRGGESGEERRGSAEDLDIALSNVTATDVQQAMVIMSKGFGVNIGGGGVEAIEKVFSDKIREAVKKLLEKLNLVFAQNDFKVQRPSGYEKRTSELWLRPSGEPDEDSVLMEPHKLMWRVVYRMPHQRGRLHNAPATVPKKLIVVQDESGSTLDGFGGASVLSVEAFVSLVTLAGLRYKNGAKEVEVLKFSDYVDVTYSGSDEVEAGVRIMMPHRGAGGGTNIVRAVREALWHAEKNAAIVVVTDAEIPNYEAEVIGSELRRAIDSGWVGFVVFVIVNERDVASIDVIKKSLQGKNAVVEHVKNADDLVQLSNNIVSHILTVYSSS